MKLVVCGNLTLDEIGGAGRLRVLPGGSALYVSAAASFLGASVDAVSSIGRDYPLSVLRWLQSRNVNVSRVNVCDGPTTRFRLHYRNSSRKLRLIHPGRKIEGDSLDRKWDAVHFGPVFGEVGRSMVRGARLNSKFLSLDVQGMVRSSKTHGFIELVPKRLRSVLRLCNFVKTSLEEARTLTSIPNALQAAEKLASDGPEHVVVSQGGRGIVLVERDGGRFLVPSYPEKKLVDPTGAGDAFVGGWIPTFMATGDSVWSASVGSAIASMIVRHRGLAKFRLSREDLFCRSAWVYTRVKRLDSHASMT